METKTKPESKPTKIKKPKLTWGELVGWVAERGISPTDPIEFIDLDPETFGPDDDYLGDHIKARRTALGWVITDGGD